MTRRQTLALGAGAAVLPLTGLPARAAALQPVLVELFTSQGCSSCPKADRLATELAQDPNAWVVSFNVDYWDYLGWRDTLAKPEFSQRQYDYASARGDGQIYTPQMVVNGRTHVVGSDKTAVLAAISQAQGVPPTISLQLSLNAHDIKVEIPKSPMPLDATLWLLAVEPSVEQKIERGENSGQTVVYSNVVRNLVPAAMWSGEAYSGSWMRDAVMTAGCTTCVAVLQSQKAGPVLGLARA